MRRQGPAPHRRSWSCYLVAWSIHLNCLGRLHRSGRAVNLSRAKIDRFANEDSVSSGRASQENFVDTGVTVLQTYLAFDWSVSHTPGNHRVASPAAPCPAAAHSSLRRHQGE